MKREQRQIYLELGDIIGGGLDSFCKYAVHCSNGSICDEGETWLDECKHPLKYKFGFDSGFFDDTCECPMTDCWGFKPKYTVSDIADIVGIILANDWGSYGWQENNGQIEVYGLPKGGDR